MNNNTTKKAEIVKEIKVNDNWADMLGLYLAKDVKRTWAEDFVNEENGEVQTIDRYETIALRGSEIDAELIQELSFMLTSGDIKSVFVSNQQRKGYEVDNHGLYPCIVTAMIKKKRNIQLYANSLRNAIEIATDYIELNYESRFTLLKAKFIDHCVFVNITPAKASNDNDEQQDKKEISFYKVEAIINRHDYDQIATFVLLANDIDEAKTNIERHVSAELQEKVNKGEIDPDDVEYHVTIKSGKQFNIYDVVSKDFSLAYCGNNE